MASPVILLLLSGTMRGRGVKRYKNPTSFPPDHKPAPYSSSTQSHSPLLAQNDVQRPYCSAHRGIDNRTRLA